MNSKTRNFLRSLSSPTQTSTVKSCILLLALLLDLAFVLPFSLNLFIVHPGKAATWEAALELLKTDILMALLFLAVNLVIAGLFYWSLKTIFILIKGLAGMDLRKKSSRNRRANTNIFKHSIRAVKEFIERFS